MSKCNECEHDGAVMAWKDSPCVCCIHNKVKDNFKAKQWVPKYIPSYEINTNVDYQAIAFYIKIAGRKPAEDLAKRLKQLATLYAWANEHGFLRDWETGVDNYYVYYDHGYKEWMFDSYNSYESPNEIYMSKGGAIATVEALNDGVLVL